MAAQIARWLQPREAGGGRVGGGLRRDVALLCYFCRLVAAAVKVDDGQRRLGGSRDSF